MSNNEMRWVVYSFLSAMRKTNLGKIDWTRKELLSFANSIGFAAIPTWILNDKSRRSTRGMYSFPEMHIEYAGLDNPIVIKDGRGRPRKNLSAVTV